MTLLGVNGDVGLVRDVEVESATATLGEQRRALFQRLLHGASGGEVVTRHSLLFLPSGCESGGIAMQPGTLRARHRRPDSAIAALSPLVDTGAGSWHPIRTLM